MLPPMSVTVVVEVSSKRTPRAWVAEMDAPPVDEPPNVAD
jgi:hypothetical protein